MGYVPPCGESIVRATFMDAGVDAPRDLIRLYGAIGGMESHDDELWRLWPLSDVADRKSEANDFGVLFSDYLIDSWAYRIQPNNMDTSAVFLDYYDSKDSILVARTLAEFFDEYVENADRLLTQTS
jgi:hypothetical protein